MNTKIILAIAAIAVVAAALVGVTAAEFATNQTTTQTANSQALPPCTTANGVVPPYCINATNGEPYCNNNGTCTDYCQDNQTCNGYNACEQNRYREQYRYGCGSGMMGRNSWGRCW